MSGVLILALLGGCGASRSDVITAKAQRDLDATVARGMRSIVVERCDGRSDSMTGTQAAHLKGRVIYQPCGLVWTEMTALERVRGFVEDVCHEDPAEGMSEACTGRLTDAIFARYEERYFAADWVRARAMCEAEGKGCTAERREIALQKTHNEAVFAWLNGKREEIQLAHDRAQLLEAERRQRAATAFQAFSRR